MPQVTTQNSQAINNNVIENSLSIGMSTLAQNLAASRKKQDQVVAAANQMAQNMILDKGITKGSAMTVNSDGIQHYNQKYQDSFNDLLGNDDVSQKAESTGLTAVPGQTALKTAAEYAEDVRKSNEAAIQASGIDDAQKVIAQNMQNNAILPSQLPANSTANPAGGGVGSSGGAVGNLMNIANGIANNQNNMQNANLTQFNNVVTGNTGGTGGSNNAPPQIVKTKTQAGVATSDKESYKGQLKFKGEDADYEQKDSIIYEGREQENIKDEIKTDYLKLNRMAMMQRATNLASGVDPDSNPFEAMKTARLQLLKEVGDKIGGKRVTVTKDTSSKAKVTGKHLEAVTGATSGSYINVQQGGSTLNATTGNNNPNANKLAVASATGKTNFELLPVDKAGTKLKIDQDSFIRSSESIANWAEAQRKGQKPDAKGYYTLRDANSGGVVKYNPNAHEDFKVMLPRGEVYNRGFVQDKFGGSAINAQP